MRVCTRTAHYQVPVLFCFINSTYSYIHICSYSIYILIAESSTTTLECYLLLIELIRGFESRRGEILNLFTKKKKRTNSCWERLLMAWVSTTAVRPQSKSWNVLAISVGNRAQKGAIRFMRYNSLFVFWSRLIANEKYAYRDWSTTKMWCST